MKIILFTLFFVPYLIHGQTISITTPTDTVCAGSNVSFRAMESGITIPHFQWKINGANMGMDSTLFITDMLNNRDTVTCLLTNNLHDTIFAVSNVIITVVQHVQNAGIITGKDSICMGSSIVLADTVPGGAWIASNGNASVTGGTVASSFSKTEWDYPGPPPIDTIYYIVSNSCGSDSASKSLVTIVVPVAWFQLDNGTTNSICLFQDGYTVDEAEIYPDIIFSEMGNVGYSDGYVFGLQPGNDIIVSVCTNYCGTDTFRYPVTVYGFPDAGKIIASKDSLCPGDSIALLDTTYTGNYLWNSSNLNAVVNGKGIVTGICSGVSTISFGVGNPCYNNWTSITVTVNPPFQITDTGLLCNGHSLVLSDSSEGGTWSSENPEMATIGTLSGEVTGILPGTVTITYRLPTGCATETVVTINPTPAQITGDNLVCVGSEVTLSDTGNGIWSTIDSDVYINNPNMGIISGMSKGYATIKYIAANGCYDSVILSVINCAPLISVFPNPVRNEILVQADTLLYNYFIITNVLGQRILEQSFNKQITTINTENFTPGIYIIYISGDVEYSYCTKFEKE